MEKKAFSTWGTTILLLNKWVYRKSTVASCVTNFKTKETNKFLKRIDTKNFTRLPNQFSKILSHPLPWEYPLTSYDRNYKSTMSWKGNSVAAEIHLRIFLAITVTMILSWRKCKHHNFTFIAQIMRRTYHCPQLPLFFLFLFQSL